MDLSQYISNLHLDAKLKALAAKASPRASSSRMIVTVVTVAGLLWLCKGNVQSILGLIGTIVVCWLICRTATDIATILADAHIKGKIAHNITKDGELSDTDATYLK